MSDKKTALYRWFNERGDLLYVGVSASLPARIKQHRHGSSFVEESSRMTIEWHNSREDALEAERVAIITESPKHNIIFNTENKQPVESPFDEEYFVDTSSSPIYVINAPQLCYFIGVCETGNMGRFAMAINRSQPTLSVAIKRFQENIGMRLLVKDGPNLKKTRKGQLVYEAAKELEAAFLEFEERLKQIKDMSDDIEEKPRRYLHIRRD